MAYVIGPNGVRTYIPDNCAADLVGDGTHGYTYAPDDDSKTAHAAKKAPAKRAPRKPKP